MTEQTCIIVDESGIYTTEETLDRFRWLAWVNYQQWRFLCSIGKFNKSVKYQQAHQFFAQEHNNLAIKIAENPSAISVDKSGLAGQEPIENEANP